MVERVARALLAFQTGGELTLDDIDENWRKSQLAQARAAIAAMREPDATMVAAAQAALDDGRSAYIGNDDLRDAVAAMIDQALSEDAQ